MSTKKPESYGLYNPAAGSDSCGVGFITRKDGEQTHDILRMAHSALCTVPHRGGMSAEGVGDGAGVNVDLSLRFFRKVTGQPLEAGRFGVGNFFVPKDAELRAKLSTAGYEPAALNGPNDFAKFIAADTNKWMHLAVRTNLKTN